MNKPEKAFSTIGCCGIDCGLCPRHYTAGASRCPGCGGAGFHEKHPACGVLTCCVTKHGSEVCADCADYPCRRFDGAERDSFVTHQRMADNLSDIHSRRMDAFLAGQQRRIAALEYLLAEADDGRSKSFYCLACALLLLAELEAAVDAVRGLPKPERNRAARERLDAAAERCGTQLKLRK